MKMLADCWRPTVGWRSNQLRRDPLFWPQRLPPYITSPFCLVLPYHPRANSPSFFVVVRAGTRKAPLHYHKSLVHLIRPCQFPPHVNRQSNKKKKIKMRFTLASAALATIAAATSASAADIQVQVGSNGLSFSPNSVNASVGDTVSFVFFPKNHTVTQSSFAAPCQPLASGIDSGFQPVAAGATTAPSFSVTINATTPLWFYCRQSSHCESGMVFAVNPTANKSFETFQATAKASSSDGTPPSAASSASGSTASSPSSTSTGSSSSSTGKSNSALTTNARAGGLLAALGMVAGILL
ncbi:Cupredoxin [Lactarius hatsudake]|nr:Cupredoxin [Lactarius hatsudake]